jgi:signal peptidase I
LSDDKEITIKPDKKKVEIPKKRSGLVDLLRTWGPAILAVFLIRTYVFEPFNIPSPSMVPTLLIGDYVVVNRSSYGLWVPGTLVDLNIIPGADNIWIPPRFELLDWGDPERGDIIVFRYPVDPKTNFIKRVVGISGDEITVKDNQIFVNGEEQERVLLGRYAYQTQVCGEMGVRTHDLYRETFGKAVHPKLMDGSAPGQSRNFPSPSAKSAQRHIVPEGKVFVMGDNRDHSMDSRTWGFVDESAIKGKAHFIIMSWNSCKPLAEKVRGKRLFQSLYSEVAPNVPASE